jgi:hypothetical protein
MLQTVMLGVSCTSTVWLAGSGNKDGVSEMFGGGLGGGINALTMSVSRV